MSITNEELAAIETKFGGDASEVQRVIVRLCYEVVSAARQATEYHREAHGLRLQLQREREQRDAIWRDYEALVDPGRVPPVVHFIAPVCAHCRQEIDKDGDQWFHVGDREKPFYLKDGTVKLSRLKETGGEL